MRFVPSYSLQMLEESKYEAEMEKVEKVLEGYKQSGNITAFDGTGLYYEYFLAENPKANIVIVHGLSEFTKKFYEVTWYFLHQGYNVFLYDQRCHGLSGRLTDDRDMMHVNSFREYAVDLNQFIEEVVIPTENLPIYLYAHSMGGAVCALYLAERADRVSKAVLSAPLFEPVVNDVPGWLALASVIVGKIFRGPKKRFFLCRDFDPNVKFDHRDGTSENRFYYNLKLRKENENYRSTPRTFGWTYCCLTIKNIVLKKKFIAKLQTPMLLISGEKDRTVKNSAHKRFAENYALCTRVELPGETHALLAGENEQLEKTIRLILDFYGN